MIFSPPRHQATKNPSLYFIIRNSLFAIPFFFAIGLSPSAFADGTTDISINPATGYTISASGSYRVVSDVTMTAGVAAITISTNDVTIDLGGHTITGGGGAAVDGISGGARNNVTIYGGTIAGFSNNGIVLNDRAHVRDLAVRGCTLSGMYLIGGNAIVERCRVTANDSNNVGGYPGIQVGQSSVVKDCVVSGNSPSSGYAYGIYLTGTGCRAEGNVCENNVATGGYAYGIYGNASGEHVLNNVCTGNNSSSGVGDAWGISLPFDSAVVLNNVCEYNTSAGRISGGINVAKGCLVENNVCNNNTCNSVFGSYGILTGNGCTIRGNTCWSNSNTGSGTSYGISAAVSCTVEGNTCYNNNANALLAVGIYVNGWSTAIHNTCSSNNITGASGNAYGIYAGGVTLVRDNTSGGQTAAGTGFAAGIVAFGGCSVVGNHCGNNTGGAMSHGIRVLGGGQLVAGNSTNGNGTAGLFFNSATNNRSHSNQFRETTGIDLVNGVAPASAGAGDLADVVY